MTITKNQSDILQSLSQILSETGIELDHSLLENYDTNLSELGITSLIFAKIAVAIEEQFSFEFDDEDLDANKFTTIEDLVRYIFERSES